MLESFCPIVQAILQVNHYSIFYRYLKFINLTIILNFIVSPGLVNVFFLQFYVLVSTMAFDFLLVFLVTMQAPKESPPDMQCKDKFLIQSVVAPDGVASKDISPELVGLSCCCFHWFCNF